jgi:ParB family transcriptional regulator, chromosome partitioning protein
MATLEERREQVASELQAMEDALQDYARDMHAVAGAIVTIDREGEGVVYSTEPRKPTSVCY